MTPVQLTTKHGTGIDWTHFPGYKGETWNCILGCSTMSPGCAGCYATALVHMRASNPNPKIQQANQGLTSPSGNWTGEVRVIESRLDQPARWRNPRSVFAPSLSDLFHENLDPVDTMRILEVMTDAHQHRFLVLTKRPDRMQQLLADEAEAWETWIRNTDLADAGDTGQTVMADLFSNIAFGTSIESNDYVHRADHVRAIKPAMAFLSIEPLIGPVPDLDLTGIDWVIVGGESGPKARPMHPDWARQIRDRCVQAGIPFWFKQWGAYIEIPLGDLDLDQPGLVMVADDGRRWNVDKDTTIPAGTEIGRPVFMRKVNKKAAGDVLDGRLWKQFPQWALDRAPDGWQPPTQPQHQE